MRRGDARSNQRSGLEKFRLNPGRLAGFVFMLLLARGVTEGFQERRMTVMVITPGSTPRDARLYIAGNLPQLGNWRPDSVSLTRLNDSEWTATVGVPDNFDVEFKVTRGSWNTQAIYEKGIIPSNTMARMKKDTTMIVRPTGWSDSEISRAGKITGAVRYHRGLEGEGLRYARDLIVWLPPSYEKETRARYPVLYMHDGQNVFDPATSFLGADWRVDDVADSLIRKGKMREIIVVAMYNTPDRVEEYSDTKLGKAYCDFVIGKVKPLIDSTYRTEKDAKSTAVMGSSMGGLISFLFAWWHPEVFSKAGCLSAVFGEKRTAALNMVEEYDGAKKPLMVYMDCGGARGDKSLYPDILKMKKLLQSKGYGEDEVVVYYDPKAEHTETAWAARVWKPLALFFPPLTTTRRPDRERVE